MFDVGRSTCPQCLDGGVSRIQPFDLYVDVNTNQMHYTWQAGVRRSLVSFLIRLEARGQAVLAADEAKRRDLCLSGGLNHKLTVDKTGGKMYGFL